jgi:hypothetical protein
MITSLRQSWCDARDAPPVADLAALSFAAERAAEQAVDRELLAGVRAVHEMRARIEVRARCALTST